MTTNNRQKKIAREHATKTGVSYTQALREVTARQATSINGTFTPFTTTIVTIQPAMDPTTMRLPYPFHLNATLGGVVERQDFWQGNVLQLIGFADPADPYNITLFAREFWADPEQAVGMEPVFSDVKGNWATHDTVGSVAVSESESSNPMDATLTVANPYTSDAVTIHVGHLTHLLWDNLIAPDGTITPTGGELLLRYALIYADRNLPADHPEQKAIAAAQEIDEAFEAELEDRGIYREDSDVNLSFTLTRTNNK